MLWQLVAGLSRELCHGGEALLCQTTSMPERGGIFGLSRESRHGGKRSCVRLIRRLTGIEGPSPEQRELQNELVRIMEMLLIPQPHTGTARANEDAATRHLPADLTVVNEPLPNTAAIHCYIIVLLLCVMTADCQRRGLYCECFPVRSWTAYCMDASSGWLSAARARYGGKTGNLEAYILGMQCNPCIRMHCCRKLQTRAHSCASPILVHLSSTFSHLSDFLVEKHCLSQVHPCTMIVEDVLTCEQPKKETDPFYSLKTRDLRHAYMYSGIS